MNWLSTIPVAIPLALRLAVRWICWRVEMRDGRPAKVPYNASGPPRRVDVTLAETGWSFDEAVRGLGRPDITGLGFILGGSGFVAVDVDHAFEEDGTTLKRDAKRVVEALGTYTELSPSGTGLRLFVRGVKPGPKCRRPLTDGVSVEVYDKDRYVTVTGHRLPGTSAEVADDQALVDRFYERLFPAEAERIRRPMAISPMLSDVDVLDLVRNASNGAPTVALLAGDTSAYENDASRADLALTSRLAFFTQDPVQLDRLFRGSRLMRDKWDENRGGRTYGEMTIDRALDGVEETYTAPPRATQRAADRPPAHRPLAVRGPIGVRLADVEAESVRWAWNKWLTRGKLHVFDGDPGMGKSTIMAAIAASVTAGVPWPDGSAVPEEARGGVVFMTAEDDPATTIRPRMEAAGADVSRITVISTIPTANGAGRLPILPDDVDIIIEACKQIGAKLLVIDPVTAYLGGANSHVDADVRGALVALAVAAEEAGIAVVLIRHLNKSTGGSALYRGGGSIAFAGLARVVWVVGTDPNDPNRRALTVSKNNLAAFPQTLGYALESAGEFGVGRASWLGPLPLKADDLVRPPATEAHAPARAVATEFLTRVLTDGPRPAAELFAEADNEGIAEKTLRRAKDDLKIKAERVGGISKHGWWSWSLPEETDDEPDPLPALFR